MLRTHQRLRADFLDQTIATWQPRAKRPLTREDAREIVTNIVGFFEVLREWERDERGVRSPALQPMLPPAVTSEPNRPSCETDRKSQTLALVPER
jgi:hypothetical protein